MTSLGLTLQKHRGLGPGFDFLRIALAALIVATHATLLTGNFWMRSSPLWFTEYALVPMFFALSGFLVAGSATRLSLGNFLINRGLRIIPALGVDVLICALIIGPIMTKTPLLTYFTSLDFFKYFLNVTGWIHYQLPGVFKDHVNTRVNGALWTVPYEMFCYIIMSGLILSRWVVKPAFVAVVAISLFAAGMIVEKAGQLLPEATLPALRFMFVDRGAQLLLAFVLGILVYQLKDRIPYNWVLFTFCVGICVAADLLMNSGATGNVANRAVLIPALVYITIFLGLTPIPIPKIFRSGDYSYGIYLYHDPLLQVIISFFPGIVLIPKVGNMVLFALGLPAVAILATFSWHFIEKPILSLRKRFSFVARVRGVAEASDKSIAPSPLLADAKDFVGISPSNAVDVEGNSREPEARVPAS